jgi:two-component system phosphate regulon sensor histidine kinase PhoR
MFRSIRWRITIPYVFLTLVTMLGLGIYLSHLTREDYLDDLENSLTAQVSLISDSIKPFLKNKADYELYINSLAKKWADILNARVTIIDINGVVIGESEQDPTTMENHLNRPEVKQALEEGYGVSIRISATVGYEMMYVAVPVEENGEVFGFARVALPTAEIYQKISRLQNRIFIASLIAAGATIALSTVIAYLTARPLIELTQTAKKMVEDDEIHPTPGMEYDEIQQLGNAFSTLVRLLRNQISASRTEQGRLSSVLEQMTDGVLITDENGIVVLINPKAVAFFEVEFDNIEGYTLIQVVRNHQIVESWKNCKETSLEQALTLEIPRQHKFVQCIITPLQTDLTEQYLFLFQDLTRMRRLETVRRDFISNISHELRTPLASLKALTETLKGGAINDPPAAQRFLNRMETEVDALTQMVSELLELTRIESGQLPLEPQSIAPLTLIQKAIERLNVQAERANLSVSFSCPETLPNVIADPPRLGQAIVNLLHNAIKFTPPGGSILLSAWQQEHMIVFSIEDTGVGIPADDLPRIFERFYKADRARSGGGTGLGLAITRHLVEAHGGRIWAESVEGQGSKFSFTIPIMSNAVSYFK